MKTCSVSEYIT